ncbi:hypothetical protein GOBAR_AA16456 [Gossypium barbadense]|uniref:Uncharacterized protein n=1 Tax=Gossypium barbadense TaxID=3634 RepID=A0A2P5XLJ4_GOSBA|nr:hypothetical protein GOBAR_AA16456 [Gossypium barbadense]
MEVTVKGSNMIFPAQHTPKEALSKTLVPFYPMAGRLGCDENGRFQITCNAEGVLWIEAETSSVIDDLAGFTPCSQLQKLVPALDCSGDTTSYPLFMAQLTSFRCGGVCLGVTTLHTVCDGTTVLHFINSWSEMARGLSQISMPPLIDRTLLRARVPPTPRFHHLEYNPPPSLLGLIILHPCLIYTILAAYIWRCATKARGLSYDQPTRLLMPTNGRPRLHPPLPSSYLGNGEYMEHWQGWTMSI